MHNSKQEKLGVRPIVLCFILHSLLPVSLYFFSVGILYILSFFAKRTQSSLIRQLICSTSKQKQSGTHNRFRIKKKGVFIWVIILPTYKLLSAIKLLFIAYRIGRATFGQLHR